MSTSAPQGCIFLVMATGIKYGQPPVPLLAFQKRPQAEEWQAEIIDYHINPPEMPVDDNGDDWKQYNAQLEAWRNGHPGGKAISEYQYFGVYEVHTVEPPTTS